MKELLNQTCFGLVYFFPSLILQKNNRNPEIFTTAKRTNSSPGGNKFTMEFTKARIKMDIIAMTEKKRNPFGDTNESDILIVNQSIYIILS